MAWKYETSGCGHKEQAPKETAQGADPQELSGSMGIDPQELPALTGTEKQVAWANTLRAAAVNEISEILQKMREAEEKTGQDVPYTADELQRAAAAAYETHTEAYFWIENRLEPRRNLMFWFLKEYKERALTEIPKEVKAELMAEKARLTVRPVKAVKSGVVELTYKNGFLKVQYVKDDKFLEIVKRKKFRWERPYWKREITQYTGSAQDRAAELGNALLTAGFTVCFFDKASKQKAISGAFKPEQERWIAWDEEMQKLTLIWNGKNDILYNASRKLPGARLEKGKIRVSVEFHVEVKDFADRMGFSISREAREKILLQIQKENRFEVRQVKKPKRKDIGDKERLKKTLVASGAIIEDLKDDIE